VLFGPSGRGIHVARLHLRLVRRCGVIKFNDEYFFNAARRFSLPAQMRRIAYVFQSLALFLICRGRECRLCLSAFPSPERQERVERILPAFHIEALRRRKPGELSGEKSSGCPGALAVTQPQLLLLDEP